MTLTPSDRIKLIKEVSARLTMEEWPLIDLTLKQFGLPWSNQWNGTKDSYIIEMVENASDETLIELGQHVGFQFEEAGRLRVEPPFWREGMFKLTLSNPPPSFFNIYNFLILNKSQPDKADKRGGQTA